MKKSSKFIVGVGNLGLSFIELIITLAIMAVVGTTIAGAMYVSSSSYTRGAAEVNVQEEAQVALNLISDWVMDATEVENPDPKTLKITHPNEDSVNIITVYQSGDQLMYKVDSDPNAYVLCDYLDSTGVTFNSTFDTDRNVNISVDFNIKGRTYHAATDTTSRNHDFTLNSTGSDVLNLTVPDSTIVLEPGMNGAAAYTFDAVVYGAASAPNITPSDKTGDFNISVGTVTATGSSVYTCPVTVSSTDTASADGSFKLSATYSDGANTFTDTEVIVTLVRRATQAVYNTSDKNYLDPVVGEEGKAGSMYVNTVNLGITNMAPRLNSAFDNGTYAYVDPSKVEFYLRYEDGTVVPSSVYTINTVDHGNSPSISVTLNSTVSKDILVYVSSVHSGPNTAIGSSPNNKASRILGSSFSYTGGGAYVSYFKIKKGDDPLIHVGTGFQRGANKFLIGELSADTYNYLSQAGLLRTDGSIRYVVSLRFKEKNASDYIQSEDHPYILSITTTDPRSDANNVFGCTGAFTSMFDCDKAYTIEVTYSLYANSPVNFNGVTYTSGMKIKSFTSEGNIAATSQFCYNDNSHNFESNYGTSTNPIDFSGRTGDVYLSVYHDTINVKGYLVIGSDGVDRYNPATNTWVDYSNPSIGKVEGVNTHSHAPNGSGNYHYQQWVGNTLVDRTDYNVGVIYLDTNGTLTTKYVKGYDENKFPDPAVTYTELQLTNYPPGQYRVRLHVNGYNNAGHYGINTLGSLPSPTNPSGTIGGLTSSGVSNSEDLGYVYFNF